MKTFLTFTSLLLALSLHGRTIQQIDKDLTRAFAKIEYWYTYDSKDDEIDRYDSLEKANTNIEKMLLKYTASNPKTLIYTFSKLSSNGSIIRTSQYGLFRMYSCNTNTVGTIGSYRIIFQSETTK